MLTFDQITRSSLFVALSVFLLTIAVDRRVRRRERIAAALFFGITAFAMSVVFHTVRAGRFSQGIPGFSEAPRDGWGAVWNLLRLLVSIGLVVSIPLGIGFTFRALGLRALSHEGRSNHRVE